MNDDQPPRPPAAPGVPDRDGSSSSPDATNPEAASARPATASNDVVFVCGASQDGAGVQVVRVRDDTVSTGELREAKDGQPIMGELVKLSKREDTNRLFDVEVLAKPAHSTSDAQRKGPAKVASDAYRDGWEAVFGKRPNADLN